MTSQAEQTLNLFDANGETAALRRLLDLASSPPPSFQLELPDGSAVSRNPETGSYTFHWNGIAKFRRQHSPVIFNWPDGGAVLNCMLLDFEKEATPEGHQWPSRGDDPLITVEEAEDICPELHHLLKLELDILDPPDSLWEDLDNQVQLMAQQLADRLEPHHREQLLKTAKRKILAAAAANRQ